MAIKMAFWLSRSPPFLCCLLCIELTKGFVSNGAEHCWLAKREGSRFDPAGRFAVSMSGGFGSGKGKATVGTNKKKKKKKKGGESLLDEVKPAVAAAAAPEIGGVLTDADYSTFPRLLPSVMRTIEAELPPSASSAAEADSSTGGSPLPPPMQGRLAAVHGFPNFDGVGSGATDCRFPGIRVLHAEPPVLCVDDFFTPEECDRYIALSLAADDESGGVGGTRSVRVQSKTLGKDADAAAQRTSTTWFHHFEVRASFHQEQRKEGRQST